MARYIDEILQPGEKVLYSTNAHWIFYLPAILAWIVALVLFVLSRQTIVEGLVLLSLVGAGLVALAALYWTVKAWFHRFTTETDVTNLRVVHKTGFIKRRSFEMALDKVESVDVDQSIPGRLFNYGDVTIVEQATGNALVDVDALDLVQRHLEAAALDEAGLVHHPQIGDVGLGGEAVEPGLDGPVQGGQRDKARPDERQQHEPLDDRLARQHEQDQRHDPGQDGREVE